ncbi:MAG: hypothetical protein ACQEP1_06145 [Nanobdellota archaeon]
MRKTMLIPLILVLILLAGCGTLYGEKIHEEKKDYSKETTFRFNLEEDRNPHNINLDISYKETRNRIQGEFRTELTFPDGQKQRSSFDILNKDKETTISVHKELNLFKITPEAGEYTLKITEKKGSNIEGKSLTAKVYREEKEETE